ncbi:MAG: PIN domain-containing protein [Candidatus Rokuibacteriota bacterium]|nr:MAG: PIN domain-containing protein [Candidatus Rokubacteria bacterium]
MDASSPGSSRSCPSAGGRGRRRRRGRASPGWPERSALTGRGAARRPRPCVKAGATSDDRRRERRAPHGGRGARLPSLRLVPIDAMLAETSAGLAGRFRLRGADAVYVAVAASLRLPLVTWDADQRDRVAAIVRVTSPDE